jgi:hypothetical protein
MLPFYKDFFKIDRFRGNLEAIGMDFANENSSWMSYRDRLSENILN